MNNYWLRFGGGRGDRTGGGGVMWEGVGRDVDRMGSVIEETGWVHGAFCQHTQLAAAVR